MNKHLARHSQFTRSLIHAEVVPKHSKILCFTKQVAASEYSQFPLLLAVLRVHCSSLASLALEALTRVTSAEVVCHCLPDTLKKIVCLCIVENIEYKSIYYFFPAVCVPLRHSIQVTRT